MSVRTLVVLAHPHLAASRINAALAATAAGTEGVTVHDLYAAWPDGRIDVAAEQQRLLAYDRVVLQFPFYWYSAPPLLKQWLDEVLTYGFAYGTGGTALHGRTLRVATSTGGGRDAYRPGGTNRFPVADLLLPFDATAHLTGMRYQEPFVVYGVLDMTDEQLAAEQARYRALLLAPAADGEGPGGVADAAAQDVVSEEGAPVAAGPAAAVV
ncbi:NAD(P)H-dependent oxidoreductase [Streptomyces pactum]|uniref:NAD(P)H-dependent oxidoreductase n=1 Tax=Streptomyces pactum TaxID=68249 RepID=UPI0036FF7CE0